MKVIASLLLVATAALAQSPGAVSAPSSYDERVPTPQSVLGYKIGEWFTDYRNLERYLEKLVASSDRVKRIVYGETYGRRPLQLLIISSPENLARLEDIRSSNLKLTDPRQFKSRAEVDRLLQSLPAIVWLSYGVHGNESSSPEAAMLTAYQLVAGTDEQTRAILENTVVLIDPNVNPDGRERYVQWANSVFGSKPNPNPDAVEHNEPWPGGRTNHYYFDLNRDWSWQTQKETLARVKAYRAWMPHVHVDYHEMNYTSSYFFFPAAVPIHETLPPEVVKWGTLYGRGNAEALDRLGEPYFVGENFDMLYPGYGDSWPTFNGAIGMTYEQAGHSRAGLVVRKPGGELLTLKQRARNHFVTGMATLATTVRHKRERLFDFFSFWESGTKHDGPVRGFIIKEGIDPNRTRALVALLLRQGIEVHRLTQDVQLDAQRYYTPKASRSPFPRGTYFISLEQPQRRLATALLEPQAAVRDTFFYDISAWSLPVAFGVEAYSTTARLPGAAVRIETIDAIPGRIIGDSARFAYLIPWERNDAVKLVWQLQARGYRCHVAARSFETLGRPFGPGTVVVFAAQNPPSLHHDIAAMAQSLGVDVYSVWTALTDKGISLGSNHIRPLKHPSIAILTDIPVSATAYGELWFMFDREYEIPFTAIRARELGAVALSKYDVIIIPNGGEYRTALDSTVVSKLKKWVDEGGVLIGLQGGATFLGKNKSGLTSALLQNEKKDEEKTQREKDEEKARKDSLKLATLFEKQERDRLEAIPGAIFRVIVDTTHPIGYGIGRELYVLKDSSVPLLLSDEGHNVARFTSDTTEVSGYASPVRASKVADSAFIIEFTRGKGRVVLVAESLTFRMFWKGLQKLLFNTVLFLPQAD